MGTRKSVTFFTVYWPPRKCTNISKRPGRNPKAVFLRQWSVTLCFFICTYGCPPSTPYSLCIFLSRMVAEIIFYDKVHAPVQRRPHKSNLGTAVRRTTSQELCLFWGLYLCTEYRIHTYTFWCDRRPWTENTIQQKWKHPSTLTIRDRS